MLEIIITSSLLILIILALRFLLRGKLSPAVIYALWAIAAVRLLIPVSLVETSISVMNLFELREEISQESFESDYYSDIDTYLEYMDSQQYTGKNQNISESEPQLGTAEENAEVSKNSIAADDVIRIAWAVGAMVVLAYTVFGNVRFWMYLRNNRTQVEYPESKLPVYLAGGIDSPCMFGIIRPAIYLNEFASEDTQRTKYIITHELTHYRHLDHIWAVVRVLCIALHWFNPLVWLAAHLSKQDCELACDSSAIRSLGDEHRYNYGRTLIDMINTKFQLSTAMMTSTTMTSDAKSIRRRIQMLRITPKNIIWAVVVTIAVMAVAVGCTFTGANSDVQESPTISNTDLTDIIQDNFPDLLAEYSTFYNPGNEARSHNLTLAANYIDGTILQPGEVFSFNSVVGERTPERGFLKAQVYSSEASDEDYGGGVAQTAGTLFNAAYMANLEITEHHSHIFTVPYMTSASGDQSYGNDAAISWGIQDLSFINSTEYPIMIKMYNDGQKLGAAIYGTDNGASTRAQMGFTETETTNYNVVFRPAQEGKYNIDGQPGRTIRVYKIITRNGSEIERYRDYEATYLPQNQVIYTDDLPEGFEYYVEYSRSDLGEYLSIYSNDLFDEYEMIGEEENSDNPLAGMTWEEIWSIPEIEYITGKAPMFKDAKLQEAAYYIKGEMINYNGEYNMYGLVPELNMLVLCVKSTQTQRAEYIAELQKAGFTYTADDGSGDVDQMCVLYNAPQYGIGVQIDGPGEEVTDDPIWYTIVLFEQRDGCYGYNDPVPKG